MLDAVLSPHSHGPGEGPLLLERDLLASLPGASWGRIPAGARASLPLCPAACTGGHPAVLQRHTHPARLQLVLPSPRAGGDGVGTGWAARGSCSPGTQHRDRLGFPARPLASPGQGPLPPPAQQLQGRPGGAGGVRGGPRPPASPPCALSLQIQPFFSSCLNDCLRHSVAVPCPGVPHTPGETHGGRGAPGGRAGEGQPADRALTSSRPALWGLRETPGWTPDCLSLAVWQST